MTPINSKKWFSTMASKRRSNGPNIASSCEPSLKQLDNTLPDLQLEGLIAGCLLTIKTRRLISTCFLGWKRHLVPTSLTKWQMPSNCNNKWIQLVSQSINKHQWYYDNVKTTISLVSKLVRWCKTLLITWWVRYTYLCLLLLSTLF